MKALVTDQEVLASLRPLDLVAYLRAHGWRPLESTDDDPVSEWSKDSERGYYELQVPRRSHWKDYPRRVREVVAVLAEEEARSQLELVADIPLVARDIIGSAASCRGAAMGPSRSTTAHTSQPRRGA